MTHGIDTDFLVAGDGGCAGFSRWPNDDGFSSLADLLSTRTQTPPGHNAGGDLSPCWCEADRDQ